MDSTNNSLALTLQVQIKEFEQEDQEEVLQVFLQGVNTYSYIKDELFQQVQKVFIEHRCQRPESDMIAIYDHYIMKSNCNFWVAYIPNTNTGTTSNRSNKQDKEINKEYKVIGCVGAQIEYMNDCNHMNLKTCELIRMYVLDGYRGYGIGSKLINIVYTWAKQQECQRLILSTLNKLDLANALYKKNQFHEFKREALPKPFDEFDRIHEVYYEKYIN